MYLLAWFHQRDLAGGYVSLVQPGEIDGLPGCSVSQLPGPELRTLYGMRQRATVRETELAARAWRAYTAPDPSGLGELLEEDTTALPFLGDALRRHLEEFPDVASGLSLSERRALLAIRGGAAGWREAYKASQAQERRPWATDVIFLATLQRLATGARPLVTTETALALTERGHAVLAGREEFSIERWRGGVHLGEHSPWRWDAARQRLIRTDRREQLD
jgi:hypothetical protein